MFTLRGVFVKNVSSLRCVSRNHPKRAMSSKSKPVPMATPTLYGDKASPPVRFVMMTASNLGIELNFHKIDLFRGEQKSEFYSKINPLQKVPALKVGNEVIRDSHAIALYLCQISKNKDFYPEEPLMKARVDQMLFFNAGTIFPLDNAIFTEFFAGVWPAKEEQVEQWNNLLDYLEKILMENEWLAGEKMTLCDLCCASTVSSLSLLLPPSNRHVGINKWLKNLQSFKFYEKNLEGLKRLKGFVDIIKKPE